jgi:hypothetical protein
MYQLSILDGEREILISSGTDILMILELLIRNYTQPGLEAFIDTPEDDTALHLIRNNLNWHLI